MRLTEELVLSRTRAPALGEVKNLNLWGQSIVDVSVLRRMPRVEVLSLSVNKIASLADFARCPVLQELYLRKNEVPDLGEVRHLRGLEHLKILWLCDNPCASSSDYRARVVRALPQLRKLDNQEITEEERAAALRSFSEEGEEGLQQNPGGSREGEGTPDGAKGEEAAVGLNDHSIAFGSPYAQAARIYDWSWRIDDASEPLMYLRSWEAYTMIFAEASAKIIV